jgi:hypothetical protein
MIPAALQTSPPFPFPPNLLIYANQLRANARLGPGLLTHPLRAIQIWQVRLLPRSGLSPKFRIWRVQQVQHFGLWSVAGDAAVVARRQRHLYPGRSRPTSLSLAKWSVSSAPTRQERSLMRSDHPRLSIGDLIAVRVGQYLTPACQTGACLPTGRGLPTLGRACAQCAVGETLGPKENK